MKYTNVINGERAKKVKLKALTHMADALSKSFGPLGSNTTIFKENQLTVYTKDGHTILKAIG
jgi:chaperonin GroEL (HSP60 family)